MIHHVPLGGSDGARLSASPPNTVTRDEAAFVRNVITATMEDGSPIRSSVKASLILERFGAVSVHPSVRRLVEIGVTIRSRRATRPRRH